MPFLTKSNKRKQPEKLHEITANIKCSSPDVLTNFKDPNNNNLNKKCRLEPNSSNKLKEVAENHSSKIKEKTIEEILKEKEETLRRLKLVEHYKTKVLICLDIFVRINYIFLLKYFASFRKKFRIWTLLFKSGKKFHREL